MEAGLSDRPWEIDDILELTDNYTAKQLKEQLGEAECDPERQERTDEASAPYWVYRSELHYTAKIHASSCSSCRNGQGKKPSAKPKGHWHPASSLEEAYTMAKALEPDRHSVCNICLGTYRTLGYRHKRSSRSLPQ